jgi:hypothetical protein
MLAKKRRRGACVSVAYARNLLRLKNGLSPGLAPDGRGGVKMPREEVVFVKCEFTRGGFPTELVFHVAAPKGGTYVGAAPVAYCRGKDRRPLQGEIARGTRVQGFLPGVALGLIDRDAPTRVYLPDGEVYEIGSNLLERKEEAARVPLQS